MKQFHDLRHAGSRYVAAPGQVRVVANGSVVHQSLEPDGQRHQPSDSGNGIASGQLPTIAPGGTAQFFGTIYNNTAGTINITSDDLNVFAPAADFTVTDQFNANVPYFIDGGLNSGDIELFDLTAALPFPDTLLVAYSGLYDLAGGPNVGDQTILNDATALSVTVSPEPGTLGLTGGALVGLCALLRRRKAHLNTLRKQ